ncbi:MAG: hypothetical protein A2X25_07755 [Chloroflexi bacterium GWB2_49_20]|nr:MAG: hypothetical protein A2X25_07755 [Chloroflexi bacterium GWB2_49_20]OGN78047.1 MAG: hypothetical protein A2X26_15560 [Chloroflexi bacterium GWC2_49_37]OGN85085.1 MAG: hypothetical protein A2X27_10260 [Chloroflexi bacterium GWD2_49_16]HBG74875.1 hypothetical protein [Anaerolineae bacterium]HCC78400.1 hypothetical protein [Anaerolineae bacterium]
MQFQTNPYLIWQLIPAFTTLWLGIYVQSRPRKKPESNVLALMMFAGAFWPLMNAIQLVSPAPAWQIFWHTATFAAIVVIPTAWFLLAVKFSGYFREQITKVQGQLFVIPTMTLLAVLTNGEHNLFFSSSQMIVFNGFTTLTVSSGPLFLLHTWYSYALIALGVVFLGIALLSNFKKYGSQAYGLIIGVLTPLVGNILYLRGAFPPGFPDPTPITFTITGITFAWAIFSGRMLDVVPIAHETVVANLSYGIVVLDLENRIMDFNQAAKEILGLDQSNILERTIAEVLEQDAGVLNILQTGLEESPSIRQELYIMPQGRTNTYEVHVSGIQDKHGHFSGRVLQFTDVSRRRQAEKNLADSQETMATILDTLQDYYFETDINGYVININKAFYSHLGYARKEDLVGKHFRHFTDRQSVRDVFLNFTKVFETKETLEMFRYSYRTKDGSEYIGEATVSPVMDGDVVVGARGVLRNITDKVVAEENLRQAKEEAEARVRELSSINRIATISSDSLYLENILQTLCVELTHIFPVRNAGIGLITADKESLEIVAFHSADSEEKSALGMILLLVGNSATQEVIENKKTVVVQNLQKDDGTKPMAGVSQIGGTKALMIVPLMKRGTVIGTIGMPAREPEYSFNKNEIRLAETIAIQIATAIDNAQLYAKTESALDFAEGDLEIGRQIQSGFFPETIPEIPGWEIAVHFEASRQVAGDFYDFFQFENSRFTALVIADVCDKGVGAALFMVLFRSLLRAFSKVDINQGNLNEHLKNIISKTNNYITEIHGNSNMFATMFLGILDPDNGILYYVNCGHEPPVILDKEGKIIRRLPPTGPAVGVFPDMDYEVRQIELNKGDFLVGYTDGTTDARNSDGELFSEERLLKCMQAPWTSLFSMVYELKNELHNYAGSQQQFDDITLISIRRKLTPDREQHAICREARMEILDELCDFVEASAAQSELRHDEALAFKLATEEVCKTIIQNGFEDRDPGFISLSFEKDPQKARLVIRDDGKFFYPDQAQPPDLTEDWKEIKIGGPGIHLVKELMDNVSYEKMKEQGNELIMEKKIHLQLQEKMNVNGF